MVLFEDHFWGEKNAGYDVLYHNMKYGSNASFKLAEFIRERASAEETYAKSLQKLAKSATSVSQLGTFEPLWGVIRVATEKHASAHLQVVQKMNDVIKILKEYGEKQKERHKQAKEEFSITAEAVQTIQVGTASLAKAKELYYARCMECERCKKDVSSPKEVEKAEAKMKKAGEEYKMIVERREVARNAFHDKMVDTCKRMQQIDEEHLRSIAAYLDEYISAQCLGQTLIDQVCDEFIGQVHAMTADKLLDQFVRSKGTGKIIPGVITFEEFTGQVENNVVNEHPPSINSKAQSGFSHVLKKTKRKKKTTKEPKSENGDLPTSEGGDPASSFEVDEEGYSIRHPEADIITNATGNSSSSNSDSDDDGEPRKIQVRIRPVADQALKTASVDEIKKITETLSLSSPSSMRRNLSASTGEGLRGRTRSGGAFRDAISKISKSSDDLLDIDFGSTNKVLNPGSDSGSSSASSHLSSLPAFSPLSGSSQLANSDSQSQSDLKSTSSNDLFTLHPLMVSSSSLDSSSNQDLEGEVPPALPVKQRDESNPSVNEEVSDVAPPLPVKMIPGACHSSGASPLSAGSESPSSSGNDAGEKNKQSAGDITLPFIKPPPLAEIPRTGSMGVAVPRPRPQTVQKRNSGNFFLPQSKTTQPQVSTAAASTNSSSQSYSAELFSCLSDFTTVTTSANAATSKSSASEVTSGNTNLSSTTSVSSNTAAVSKHAVVSYIGSTSLTSDSGSTATVVATQAMSRAVTEPKLSTSQDALHALPRSKTVGGLPTIPNIVAAKSAAGVLVNKKDDSLPIAVAFIESVNAMFFGSDKPRCMVKVTGDIALSFPASILPVLYDSDSAPQLNFLVKGISSLEQIMPNKMLVVSEGQSSGGDIVSYRFNMVSLAEHLKKQVEQGVSSYYNIDIIKYEVKTNGFSSTPLQLCSYWKCEKDSTDLRIDYRYNPSCMSAPCPLANTSVLVPMSGDVSIMQSKPSATWSGEHQRALWKIPEVSNSSEAQGSLRAKFELSKGPSTPSRIVVQFVCNAATISKLNFDLSNSAYKLSLVKKKITTGKYIAES